jgi:hypothetical protein
MDIASVTLVSLLLLLVAVGLIVSHVRSWRAYVRYEANAESFDYRRRQFRRRMQTSAMLGILAVAMPAGYLLTIWINSGWFALVFWMAVIGLACWVALLALVDIWATKHHYGRLRYECQVEQARLQAELRRIQAFRGNGKKGAGDAGRGAKERKPGTENH